MTIHNALKNALKTWHDHFKEPPAIIRLRRDAYDQLCTELGVEGIARWEGIRVRVDGLANPKGLYELRTE